MDGLQGGQVSRVDDGTIDRCDVRFDRGVELIELVRCEGDRWTALLFNSEDVRCAGRRLRPRPHDRK